MEEVVPTLKELRADSEHRAKRSLALPISGIIVSGVIGVLGQVVSPRISVYVLLFGTGPIFPLAMAVAALRGEQLFSNPNQLARLMGACVFMVNLLWALHIPLALRAPSFVPLSVGIGLGLHWVVYSWIIRHPVGYIHALLRTVMLVVAWWSFPRDVVTACSLAVVLAYAYAIYVMARRPVAISDGLLVSNSLARGPDR